MKEQESAMIRNLKDTIGTGKFACGGTLQGLPKVQLNYIQANGQWAGVTFPDVKDPEFQSLIRSSTIASFDKDNENNRWSLDSDKFTTSF